MSRQHQQLLRHGRAATAWCFFSKAVLGHLCIDAHVSQFVGGLVPFVGRARRRGGREG